MSLQLLLCVSSTFKIRVCRVDASSNTKDLIVEQTESDLSLWSDYDWIDMSVTKYFSNYQWLSMVESFFMSVPMLKKYIENRYSLHGAL